MDAAPTCMEAEAREAPLVVERLVANTSGALAALGQRLREHPPRFAVAAGRGSSDAAALLAKYLFETRLGLPTVSAAPSITSVYGQTLKLEQALVLAISQSGRSPDLVEFCRAATGPDVLRLGFVNDADSPLTRAVDEVLLLEAGPERSVAATKSCIAAMALVFGLVAHWRDDRNMIAALGSTAGVLRDALAREWAAAPAFLEGDGPIYIVGRGPGLAIAAEAALKLKETNGLHAEAVSAAEIKHGPLALVGPRLRVIVFAPRDAAFDGMRLLATDLERRGCPVLFISSDPSLAGAHVAANSEPVLELLAMLTRFYLLANESALRRGWSPDRPPFLTKITETR